ncbi:MAG: hypothetical protein AAF533_02280 [Acidobacteriota bacterium]
MSDDAFADRRKALEESFFAKQEEKARQQLKAKLEAKQAREALAEASGIEDAAVLDRLESLGVAADTVAAMSLVPLVEVAWADGKLDGNERDAILKAADSSGLGGDAPARGMLEAWLDTQPGGELRSAWKDYVTSLAESMEPAERNALRDAVLGKARSVAEAAGGFLGLGNKVSDEEQAVLADLESVFG